MTLLTGGYSILARIGMVLLIAGSLVLFGWLKGHSSEAHVFAAYRNQLATLAAVQVAHNADLVKQQRAASARIEGNYENQLAALRARSDADWLRYVPGPGTVPSLSGATGCPDAATTRSFLTEWAEDAAQLEGLEAYERSRQP